MNLPLSELNQLLRSLEDIGRQIGLGVFTTGLMAMMFCLGITFRRGWYADRFAVLFSTLLCVSQLYMSTPIFPLYLWALVQGVQVPQALAILTPIVLRSVGMFVYPMTLFSLIDRLYHKKR